MKIRLYRQDLRQDPLILDRAQSHYVCRTLRSRKGEGVYLFNETDGEWLYTLTEPNPKAVVLTKSKQVRPSFALDPLYLYFVPIKRSRLATLFAMATELGATHLIPLDSRYCQADIGKVERIEAQLVEAGEQCARLDIPKLFPKFSWQAALQDMQKRKAPIFAAIEKGEALPISVVLEKISKSDLAHGASILIGPEGGFHAKEIAELDCISNCYPIDLGSRILRSETAVASALAQYQAALAIKKQVFPRPHHGELLDL